MPFRRQLRLLYSNLYLYYGGLALVVRLIIFSLLLLLSTLYSFGLLVRGVGSVG